MHCCLILVADTFLNWVILQLVKLFFYLPRLFYVDMGYTYKYASDGTIGKTVETAVDKNSMAIEIFAICNFSLTEYDYADICMYIRTNDKNFRSLFLLWIYMTTELLGKILQPSDSHMLPSLRPCPTRCVCSLWLKIVHHYWFRSVFSFSMLSWPDVNNEVSCTLCYRRSRLKDWK